MAYFGSCGLGPPTESYNLFAIKVTFPSIAFCYWNGDNFRDHELKINVAILTGSIVGQLLFGYLADRYGRLKLYSFDLIILTYAAVCFAQSSSGANNSMSKIGLIMIWSFFAGIGIGAGPLLAATITSEYV